MQAFAPILGRYFGARSVHGPRSATPLVRSAGSGRRIATAIRCRSFERQRFFDSEPVRESFRLSRPSLLGLGLPPNRRSQPFRCNSRLTRPQTAKGGDSTFLFDAAVTIALVRRYPRVDLDNCRRTRRNRRRWFGGMIADAELDRGLRLLGIAANRIAANPPFGSPLSAITSAVLR